MTARNIGRFGGSLRDVHAVEPQMTEGALIDPPLSEDTVERLERLANLRDSGVLTDAEFELQKRMLLTTPAPPPTTTPPAHGRPLG